MSEANFRRMLRSAVRGLWNGVFGYAEAVPAMMSAIEIGLAQAWREGMGECGLTFEEISTEERAALSAVINEQYQYVFGLCEDIVTARDAGQAELGEKWPRGRPDKLAALYARVEVWVNNYRRIQHQAAALACANKKKQWLLGPTEEHCTSCAGFAGRVYRYEIWNVNGALPGSRALECRGYNCRCQLVDTDERITAGQFPRRLMG